jgi:hypothetical protein
MALDAPSRLPRGRLCVRKTPGSQPQVTVMLEDRTEIYLPCCQVSVAGRADGGLITATVVAYVREVDVVAKAVHATMDDPPARVRLIPPPDRDVGTTADVTIQTGEPGELEIQRANGSFESPDDRRVASFLFTSDHSGLEAGIAIERK